VDIHNNLPSNINSNTDIHLAELVSRWWMMKKKKCNVKERLDVIIDILKEMIEIQKEQTKIIMKWMDLDKKSHKTEQKLLENMLERGEEL